MLQGMIKINPWYKSDQTAGQLYKFILVGILNTLVGYGIFFIALIFVNYLIALILAHVGGVLTSYVWNRAWTFKSKNSMAVEFMKFESVYLIGLAINMALLYVAIDRMHLDARVMQLLLLPAITILTFIGHKLWSFKGEQCNEVV
jgi:putative flippase GtrA